MNACHQTNLEAHRILFTETSVQISCSSLYFRKGTPADWYYPGTQGWKWAVTNFRNLRLELDIYPPDLPRANPDFDPGDCIRRVLDVLKSTDHVRQQAALVKIEIQFIVIASGDTYFELDPSKWPNENVVAIRNAVASTRKEIEAERLNITITTNADAAPPVNVRNNPLRRKWRFWGN
jgi:hypothetical protein